jgi:hypothetical protein
VVLASSAGLDTDMIAWEGGIYTDPSLLESTREELAPEKRFAVLGIAVGYSIFPNGDIGPLLYMEPPP